MKELSERTLPASEQKRFHSIERRAAECRNAGRYSDAENLYNQALLRSTQVFGPDTIETAKVLNDLGILYKSMGRFSDALRQYRRALRIIRKIGAAGEVELSSLYHNLGGLEHARGRYKRAEALTRRAVAVREKIFGPEHHVVAADIAALATILDAQGKRDEAERLYRHALAVFVRLFGLENYDVAVNLNNLAALHQGYGNNSRAERLYRCALRIKNKILKPNHPDIAVTLNNLAVLYKSQGRLTEAEPLYRRALSIFKHALADTHPHVRSCEVNYGRLLAAMGLAKESLRGRVPEGLYPSAGEPHQPLSERQTCRDGLQLVPSLDLSPLELTCYDTDKLRDPKTSWLAATPSRGRRGEGGRCHEESTLQSRQGEYEGWPTWPDGRRDQNHDRDTLRCGPIGFRQRAAWRSRDQSDPCHHDRSGR
jgi:tetratricopeptide (TPR) repeat protein